MRSHAAAVAEEQAVQSGIPTTKGKSSRKGEHHSDALLDAMLQREKVKPTHIPAHEAYAVDHETVEWEEEIQRRVEAAKDSTDSANARKTAGMNIRRAYLIERWEAATEEERTAVLAEVEEVYASEMEQYEQGVKREPQTPQEAAR